MTGPTPEPQTPTPSLPEALEAWWETYVDTPEENGRGIYTLHDQDEAYDALRRLIPVWRAVGWWRHYVDVDSPTGRVEIHSLGPAAAAHFAYDELLAIGLAQHD